MEQQRKRIPELRERILNILSEPHLSCFATITEEGKPWVRYVMASATPDMKIRFASFIGTRKIKHIALNPEVHLTCGVVDSRSTSPYLQIQGLARLSTEEADRREFWNESLNQFFSDYNDPNYGVVIVVPYHIEFWTQGKFDPEMWHME